MLNFNKMEYEYKLLTTLSIGIIGGFALTGLHTGLQYLKERKVAKEFDEACEGNESGLLKTLKDEDKKRDIK